MRPRTRRVFLKVFIFLTLIQTPFMVRAGETYLQVNGLSMHSTSGYNGFNPGLGLEKEISDNWNIAGGWYYNSNYRGSAYAYGRYAYFRHEKWDLGIGLGGATGYDKWAVLPMAFPEFCYAWVCAIALPKVEASGAYILAIHARIPL